MNLLTKQDAILWKFDDITNPPANFIQIPIWVMLQPSCIRLPGTLSLRFVNLHNN
jgi:hypothetical protein